MVDNVAATTLEEFRELLISIAETCFPYYNELRFFPASVGETVDYTIFTAIRDAYNIEEPKTSIKEYCEEKYASVNTKYDITEAERKVVQRVHKKILDYRKILYCMIILERGETVPELMPDSKAQGRWLSYQLTPLQLYEIEDFGSHGILKKIVNKRICSAKDVSNTMFRELMREHDEIVSALYDDMTDAEKIIFNTMVYFDQERLFNIDIIYEIAKYTEEHGIKKLDCARFASIMGRIPVPEIPDFPMFYVTNDMIHIRKKLIKEAFFPNPVWELHGSYGMHLRLHKFLYSFLGTPLCEIVHMFSKEERAEFIKNHFWIWDSIGNQKDWTNKRIRMARKIYDYMIMASPECDFPDNEESGQ